MTLAETQLGIQGRKGKYFGTMFNMLNCETATFRPVG